LATSPWELNLGNAKRQCKLFQMTEIDEMLKAANAAREMAYVPYSNFAVGAVVRGASGRLYAGCNVENAAYPQGQCAEASAIGALILAGESEIVEALVVGPSGIPCTPCGGCRQRLREFASDDVAVHVCEPEGKLLTMTIGELLPNSFGPNHLK